MSTAAKLKSKMYWINICIALILMFSGWVLPPFGMITPMGMKVFGVFLGTMYGWIFCDLIWPSIIGIVFLGFSGYGTVSSLFSTFFSTNVVQVFFCFMVAATLNLFGATDYISGKMMSVKFLIGRPWMIVAMLFACTAILGMLTSTVPSIIIMWAIFLSVAEKVGAKISDAFVAFVLAGIVFASCFGGMFLPFKVSTLGYLSFVQTVMDVNLPYGPHMAFIISFYIVAMALYMIIGKFVFKLDASKFTEGSDFFAHLRGVKATKREKIGLLFTAIFIVVLLWPGIFPANWAITKAFSNLGLIGISVVLITIGSFLKDEDGNQIAPVTKLMRSIGWEMIFLLGSVFPMAAAINSADCGIMATVNSFVRPLVAGMSPTTLIILATLIIGLLTQVAHNGVLGAMFMPFLCPLVADMGGNPMVMWVCLFIILMCAFMTPAASMYSAMLFGHEAFKGNMMGYKYGGLILVIIFALVIASMPIMEMIY